MFAVATEILALFVDLGAQITFAHVSFDFKRDVAYRRLIIAFVTFFKLIQQCLDLAGPLSVQADRARSQGRKLTCVNS